MEACIDLIDKICGNVSRGQFVGRQQIVAVDGKLSEEKVINIGVPQESTSDLEMESIKETISDVLVMSPMMAACLARDSKVADGQSALPKMIAFKRAFPLLKSCSETLPDFNTLAALSIAWKNSCFNSRFNGHDSSTQSAVRV
uniref:Uncharacterized protein n=1 Tax=Megaselia scalaris TaxID=36166 RepID=T1GNW1_MEGSC